MKLRHAWVAGLAGLLFLAAGIVVGQQKKAAGVPMPPPHLFRIWSDAKGDTHIEEIKLAAVLGLPARAQVEQYVHPPEQL